MSTRHHATIVRSNRWRRTAAGLMILLTAVTWAPASADQTQPASGDFGRIFRLPPFAAPTPEITAALLALGKRGGLMDARDDLAAGPVALIVDPSLSRNNRDNDEHTAGVTFIGQFLDHDMTFDTTSRLGEPTNPRTAPNARRPYFDLDSVYGDGPSGSPLLYDPNDRAKFRLEWAAGSRICRATHRGAPSSRIPATTRTSSSPVCRSRSCDSTIGSSTHPPEPSWSVG